MYLSCGMSDGAQGFLVGMGDGVGSCCDAVESPALLLILKFCL